MSCNIGHVFVDLNRFNCEPNAADSLFNVWSQYNAVFSGASVFYTTSFQWRTYGVTLADLLNRPIISLLVLSVFHVVYADRYDSSLVVE